MKRLITALLLLIGLTAMALDTTQCPSKISVEITQILAYQSSSYSHLPGWLAARNSLREMGPRKNLNYTFTGRDQSACYYQDGSLAQAKLMTIKINDPEEPQPIATDGVQIRFTLNRSELSVFMPVTAYSLSGIKQQAYAHAWNRSKIRAVIFSPEIRRKVFLDIGLGRIELK